MVGILVHGNNHFILSGPTPDEATALALAWHWSIIQIGLPYFREINAACPAPLPWVSDLLTNLRR